MLYRLEKRFCVESRWKTSVFSVQKRNCVVYFLEKFEKQRCFRGVWHIRGQVYAWVYRDKPGHAGRRESIGECGPCAERPLR